MIDSHQCPLLNSSLCQITVRFKGILKSVSFPIYWLGLGDTSVMSLDVDLIRLETTMELRIGRRFENLKKDMDLKIGRQFESLNKGHTSVT